MKKNIKVLAAAVLVSMVAGTSLFAAPVSKAASQEKVTVQNEVRDVVTLTGKVKVSKKGLITFEARNGNTYAVSVTDADSATIIKARKNKMLILSGYVNDISNVFEVIQVGGLNPAGAEK